MASNTHNILSSQAFVESGDQSYNHPAAGAGGFGAGGNGLGSTQGQTGTAETIPSYGGNTAQGSNNIGQYGSSGVGHGLGTDLDSARLASHHGTTDEYTYAGQGQQTGATGNLSNLPSSGHGAHGLGGASTGAGLGGAGVASGLGSSHANTGYGQTQGSDLHGLGSGHANTGYSQTQSSDQHDSHRGRDAAAYGAAGAGAAGAASYASKHADSNPSAGGHSGSGYGGDNARNLTGDSRIDNTIGNKIEERTDKDGFTNLAGDKNPGYGLTGRVKHNADNDDSPVVETTKKRSDRDSQGRELDSYGKPYTNDALGGHLKGHHSSSGHQSSSRHSNNNTLSSATGTGHSSSATTGNRY